MIQLGRARRTTRRKRGQPVFEGRRFLAVGKVFGPVTIIAGRARQAAPISLGCFLVGLMAIPMLVAVLVTLSSFGAIDLDQCLPARASGSR